MNNTEWVMVPREPTANQLVDGAYEVPDPISHRGELTARMVYRAMLAAAPQAPAGEPVAWRDHVEQRLRTWKQSHINRSGDQLSLDDFMGKGDIDNLIDYVCDEWSEPEPTDKLRAAAEHLIERCAVSDDCQYGTLSTAYVRDILRDALKGE